MTKEKCPECGRLVYELFQKDNRVACAYCFKNLWAINEEKKKATTTNRRR
ncbi:MAG: hypothetical protein JRE40_15120 [Deltaproteobacteria bacterium]|nr:hypothetical protein [Deltaproteobacteria bacterium]